MITSRSKVGPKCSSFNDESDHPHRLRYRRCMQMVMRSSTLSYEQKGLEWGAIDIASQLRAP